MSLPVCKFYSLNQTCRFGKHCRYSHELSQRPPPFSDLKNSNGQDLTEARLGTARPPTSKVSLDHTNFQSLPPQNDRSSDQKQAFLFLDSSSSHTAGIASDPSYKQDRNDSEFENPHCSYFANGRCRYGNNCRFSHGQPQARKASGAIRGGDKKAVPPRFRSSAKNPPSRDANTPRVISEETQDVSNIATQVKPSPGPPSSKGQRQGRSKQGYQKRLCAYFKAGRCNRGANCKFSHGDQTHFLAPQDKENQHCVGEAEEKAAVANNKPSGGVAKVPNQNPRQPVQRPVNSQQVFTLVELKEVGVTKVRNREIEAIKRRFPRDRIVYSDKVEAFDATFKFVPSDPDWPFDVKEYSVAISVPPDYPKQTLRVTLPLDQDLPATVRRYLEVSIQEWVEQRQEELTQSGKAELMFRPLLRWLDRSIEDLTTEALKQLKRELTARAAGLEFIPAQKLQARFQAVSESSIDAGKEAQQSGIDESEDEDKSTSEDDDDDNDISSETDEEGQNGDKNQTLELQPQQKGTEISLKHLQLKENAAALLFQRLKIVLQCSRCKGHEDIHVSQGNVSSMSCGKCNNRMYANYRPALMHQFASVLGYLDVDGCQAFDLVLQDCRACVSCMSCNKQTNVDGLVTGQMIDGWCKACNAKFKIAAEAVKLAHLVPSGVDTSSRPVVEVAPTKSKKPPKDPSIREGYPLPEFGTCKHYKHSYRWLRFPCCGKAYPCDVCHDKKEDHEMMFANRMICGHCCKEQNYSGSRPCNGCGEHMTKVRSAHWEGGSGCRDKISMSKGDTQKYKNMNKTISRKKLETKPKKKNTKLRHA